MHIFTLDESLEMFDARTIELVPRCFPISSGERTQRPSERRERGALSFTFTPQPEENEICVFVSLSRVFGVRSPLDCYRGQRVQDNESGAA